MTFHNYSFSNPDSHFLFESPALRDYNKAQNDKLTTASCMEVETCQQYQTSSYVNYASAVR